MKTWTLLLAIASLWLQQSPTCPSINPIGSPVSIISDFVFVLVNSLHVRNSEQRLGVVDILYSQVDEFRVFKFVFALRNEKSSTFSFIGIEAVFPMGAADNSQYQISKFVESQDIEDIALLLRIKRPNIDQIFYCKDMKLDFLRSIFDTKSLPSLSANKAALESAEDRNGKKMEQIQRKFAWQLDSKDGSIRIPNVDSEKTVTDARMKFKSGDYSNADSAKTATIQNTVSQFSYLNPPNKLDFYIDRLNSLKPINQEKVVIREFTSPPPVEEKENKIQKTIFQSISKSIESYQPDQIIEKPKSDFPVRFSSDISDLSKIQNIKSSAMDINVGKIPFQKLNLDKLNDSQTPEENQSQNIKELSELLKAKNFVKSEPYYTELKNPSFKSMSAEDSFFSQKPASSVTLISDQKSNFTPYQNVPPIQINSQIPVRIPTPTPAVQISQTTQENNFSTGYSDLSNQIPQGQSVSSQSAIVSPSAFSQGFVVQSSQSGMQASVSSQGSLSYASQQNTLVAPSTAQQYSFKSESATGQGAASVRPSAAVVSSTDSDAQSQSILSGNYVVMSGDGANVVKQKIESSKADRATKIPLSFEIQVRQSLIKPKESHTKKGFTLIEGSQSFRRDTSGATEKEESNDLKKEN